MAVTFKFPADVEQRLRENSSDFDSEAKEVVVIDLFRRGKLSHFELSQVLDLDRFETDAFLKKHHVYEGSLTMEDLEADRNTLKGLLGPADR